MTDFNALYDIGRDVSENTPCIRNHRGFGIPHIHRCELLGQDDGPNDSAKRPWHFTPEGRPRGTL